MTSAELVKGARETLGLSRNDLSVALGMSKKSIAEFETGHQPVRRVVFLAIENLLRRQERIDEVAAFRQKWERIV